MRSILRCMLLLVGFCSLSFAQTHVFPATDTNNSFTGSNTFLGAVNPKNIDSVRYVDSNNLAGWAGSDMGAWINSAVADCPSICKIIVGGQSGGTISTAPNIPIGFTIEFLPGTYILATTWSLNHRNTQFFFQGATFNYNQDSGSAGIIVGKNLSGTLNCNGTTTVTQASGNNFSTFDPGDQVFIGGNTANISSITDSTHMVLTVVCGAGAGVAFAGYLNTQTAIGQNRNSIVIRDLAMNYTGAGTNAANQLLRYESVSDVLTENLYLSNMPNGSCLVAQGMLESQFNNIKLNACQNALALQARTAGGLTVGSNSNLFYSPQIIGSQAGGNPLLIDNSSINVIMGGDFEGNAATVFGTIQNSARQNLIYACDHEKNGDGTVNAADYSVLSQGNIFASNNFTSAVANSPASGIIFSTGATNSTLRDNTWNSSAFYATAWNFINGANGIVENNNNGGFAHADGSLFVVDQSGNTTIGGVLTDTAITLAPAFGTTGTRASGGTIRVATGDTLSWRNNANSGDISLGKNTTDQLTFNSQRVITEPCTPTSQKAETTTADANVLTCTPAAVAGTYRVCAVVSVSAATTGVVSWTLSWTDSNGTAQSNIAQDLFQQGTAAPNTTFTTSAAGNYNGCSVIDVNNAAANIVVKWVGGGTTTAKMSATVERII